MKKSTIRKIVEWLQSNDAGFIYALAGVVGQGVHVYFAIDAFSPIVSDLWRTVEAVVISFFFSGLLFFILRAQRVKYSVMGKEVYYEQTDQNRKYRAYTRGFAWFDSFVNLHYYGFILWYQPHMNGETIEWYKMVMAVPFSFALPWMLTLYAGEIHQEYDEEKQKDSTKPVEVKEIPTQPLTVQIKKVFSEAELEKALEEDRQKRNGKPVLIREKKKKTPIKESPAIVEETEEEETEGKGLFERFEIG
jgi:hypothetical protein